MANTARIMREDIVTREIEFDNAFKRYDGCGQFAIKAEKNGTTLWQALASYDALENLCQQDPCGGIDELGRIFPLEPKGPRLRLRGAPWGH
jgi:hypothetical protein